MLKDFKFHHIGYAVKCIESTSIFYTNEGWKLSEIYTDTIQNTRIAFLFKEKFPLIELVEPIDDKSPVVKTLDKMGVTPYHVCYEVDDIESAILEMKKRKFVPLFNPVNAIALNNRKICYLFSKHVGLIEIVNKD